MSWKEIEPKLFSFLAVYMDEEMFLPAKTNKADGLSPLWCAHAMLTANGVKYRDKLNVEGAVVVLERIAVLFSLHR